jgi:hypothetical protein
MTDLVPIHKGKSNKVSLADLQDLLDSRRQVAEARTPVSTKKARLEEAKKAFEADPLETVMEAHRLILSLSRAFDESINLDSIPLSQTQINKLSEEFLDFEKLKDQISALETRYKTLIFAHLDETLKRVPGRPAAQVPGKVAAEGPGPHYVFERRGGNREDPDLDAEAMRSALPDEIVAQLYLKVHHEAIPAWDEDVFDESKFAELVDAQVIDLDLVAQYLTPGKWRKPSFYKTLVDGE